MTVRELVEVLNGLPPDATVFVTTMDELRPLSSDKVRSQSVARLWGSHYTDMDIEDVRACFDPSEYTEVNAVIL
jgi:hypothetical protein